MSQHKIPVKTQITDKTPPGVYRVGKKIVTHTGQECLVEQSHKNMTDVNKLLEPAMKKGLLRHVVKFAGQYDDIPVNDFQESAIVTGKHSCPV